MSPDSVPGGTEDPQWVSSQSIDTQTGAKKRRIAISLFNEPLKLKATLKALMAVGFSVADLCVFGTVDTLSMTVSMFQNNPSMDIALMSLFNDVATWQSIDKSSTIVGSRGELLSTLNGLVSQREESGFNRPCDDICKVSTELVAHIEQGRWVLVVDVDKPGQLSHASKVLLKFSPHVIQSHEFLRPV